MRERKREKERERELMRVRSEGNERELEREREEMRGWKERATRRTGWERARSVVRDREREVFDPL